MKVVILCGGKGTRIRDVSADLPKPLIPIGDDPIVKHIMEVYSRHGHDEFILCTGYKGWLFKEYFLNFRHKTSDVIIDFRIDGAVKVVDSGNVPPWKVTLARTGVDAMTGCRVKRIQKYVGNETFMLTYGDGLGNIDISALVAFHKSHGKKATVTSVHPPSRFGELTLNGPAVISFEEKPQTIAGLINGGFFVCEPSVFDYITDDLSCNFERTALPRLAREGELMMFRHDGFWMPMDTYREYQLLNSMWEEGNAPWLEGGAKS